MYIPRGVAQQGALDAAVRDAVGALGPDVIHVRYTLGQDWSGEYAIFFRILLSDRASKEDQLYLFPASIGGLATIGCIEESKGYSKSRLSHCDN